MDHAVSCSTISISNKKHKCEEGGGNSGMARAVHIVSQQLLLLLFGFVSINDTSSSFSGGESKATDDHYSNTIVIAINFIQIKKFITCMNNEMRHEEICYGSRMNNLIYIMFGKRIATTTDERLTDRLIVATTSNKWRCKCGQ